MVILGVDPGSLYCGYGVIEVKNHQLPFSQSYISSGRIVLDSKKPLYQRLADLFVTINEIIDEYRPDDIVVEKMFFAKGVKSALGLGYTRGVILAASALSGRPIYEYSALQIKKAVVGYGKADKRQVQSMVSKILLLTHPISQDSADALATALCHASTIAVAHKINQRIKSKG